ncbi:hypothetical protein [Ruficoccus sp. ZRK36]|nr:hypothetical protein [Ruficoccus sp. ZRK36]
MAEISVQLMEIGTSGTDAFGQANRLVATALLRHDFKKQSHVP